MTAAARVVAVRADRFPRLRFIADQIFNQARYLARSLRPGVLLLADHNYAAADLVTTLAATGAHLLIRCKNGRKLPVLHRPRDGSFSSILAGLPIRVIDA